MNTAAQTGRRWAALAATAIGIVACGGGGSDAGPAPTPAPTLDTTQRTLAATTTASNASACTAIQPFYWEIGDKTALMASASVNASGSATSYDAASVMSIASASKWLYGAYVAELRGASGLTSDDIRYLNFRSGYTSFTACTSTQTVGECAAAAPNGDYTAANDGKFFYDGGHMQKHASLQPVLSALGNAGLATEMQNKLGTDVAIGYTQPQLAGGVRTSASIYARYLRKLLGGELRMGALLGSNPVCTNPLTCSTAVATPVPINESWHYSVGHWVEDDPVVGDGAFSSAGAFGFYPWVDAGRVFYGIVAREGAAGSGIDSAYCGRLIRKAWMTGVAQ